MDEHTEQRLLAALQQVMQYTSEIQAQVLAMRGELTQAVNEIKTTSQRIDQKDSNIMSLIDNLKTQMDMVRGEVSSSQATLENRLGSVETAAKDAKAAAEQAHRAALR